MADVKIRDLSSAASVADTDIVEITVDPGGTPATKKATIAQIRAGALPSGADGAVLARVGGAWTASAAGTARQILASAGTGAPTWGVDTLPLTQRAIDGASSAVSVCATIAHDLSTGGGAAGIGARCVLRARNSESALTDAAAIDGVLTTATGGAEVGALAISTRTGGALTERLRVHGAGGVTVGTTASLTSGVGLSNTGALWGRNAADSAWQSLIAVTSGVVVVGDTNNAGVVVKVGAFSVYQISTAGVNGFTYRGYLTASSGAEQHLKLSAPIAQTGTAGWTLLDLSPTLTTQGSGTKRAISYSVSSSERFGIDENGCVVGLRLRRTAVTDAAHTVAGLSTYVDMVGLTAARTVTGPSTPVQAGTVVTITNGDGSANGTKKVVFAPASGTVNGAATHDAITAAYGSCTYICDGTNWTVIAKV